jgi:DNA-binding protein Fis
VHRELKPASNKAPSSDLAHFVQTRLEAGARDLYAETLAVMERFLITRVLQETGGNQSKAADILGITRGKIRDRIALFGISVDKSVSVENQDAQAASVN